MKYLIGIDEVGRGCLAGPVVVAAVAVPANLKIQNLPAGRQGPNPKLKLKDSKRLTAIQRDEWNKYVRSQPKLLYAISRSSPKIIDKINIAQAANRAATKAASRLISKIQPRRPKGVGAPTEASELQITKILLDGGLYLKSLHHKLKTNTVIRGDEKFNCVKLASIIAKVSRDKMMVRLHKKYPQYRLNEHKGYGTKRHIAALKKHGPSEIHRLTFIGNFVRI